jgi:hypothetical protein
MGAQSLAQRRALADSLNSGLDVGFARVSGASGAVAGPIPGWLAAKRRGRL